MWWFLECKSHLIHGPITNDFCMTIVIEVDTCVVVESAPPNISLDNLIELHEPPSKYVLIIIINETKKARIEKVGDLDSSHSRGQNGVRR